MRLLTDRTIFPDHRTYAYTSRILSLERTKRYSFCHTVSYIQQYSNTSPRLCQASVMSKWDLDAAIIIAAAAIRADDGNCGGNGGNTGEDSDNDSNFFHQAYFLSFYLRVFTVLEYGRRIYCPSAAFLSFNIPSECEKCRMGMEIFSKQAADRVPIWQQNEMSKGFV